MNPFILRVLFLLSLCVCFMPPDALAGYNDTIELTIARDDCLINICRRYLEEPRNWREVGRINHLKDYNLIRSGKRLIIPVRLLKGVPADGRVLFMKGDVAVKYGKDGQWKPLAQNDAVRQGSLLRTGGDGAVEIDFTDGTVFFMRPDTNLSLETSQVKGGSYLLQRIKLSTGRVVTKVRRATGRDSRIEIPTPSATAVARGTDFRVSLGTDKSSTCEVLQGVVDVEAKRGRVVVREGEGTRVNKGEPPLKPRRLLPPPAPLPVRSPIRTMPFPIEFEGIKGALSYRFMLSKDPEGKDVVREGVIRAGERLRVSGLDDGAYCLQMRSIDEIGLEGPSSPPLDITVRLKPLPPFVSEPAEGAKKKGRSVVFSWFKVHDASRYQLQVAGDREFQHPLGEPKEVRDTRFQFDLPELGAYYFRICSVADDGYAGVWSDPVSFTLIPPPAAPDVEKPKEDGKDLNLRWRSQVGIPSYHLQVASEGTFSSPFIDRKVDRAEASIPRPEKAGTYYVRVSAIDEDGYEGSFSPPQTFEVKRRLWPYGLGALGGLAVILLVLL